MTMHTTQNINVTGTLLILCVELFLCDILVEFATEIHLDNSQDCQFLSRTTSDAPQTRDWIRG